MNSLLRFVDCTWYHITFYVRLFVNWFLRYLTGWLTRHHTLFFVINVPATLYETILYNLFSNILSSAFHLLRNQDGSYLCLDRWVFPATKIAEHIIIYTTNSKLVTELCWWSSLIASVLCKIKRLAFFDSAHFVLIFCFLLAQTNRTHNKTSSMMNALLSIDDLYNTPNS